MTDRNRLIRMLWFVAYFVGAFLIFLLVLFPFDRVKARLEAEVRARTPLELTVSRISPRFFNRFVLNDVVVSDPASGRVFFDSPEVRAKVSLVGFLRGMLSAELSGPAYGGEFSVKVRQGGNQHFFTIEADALDAGSYPLLRESGATVRGRIGGSFEMNDSSGKGRLWVKSLGWRSLTIKGFPVPDMDFEQGWGEVELRGDRLAVKKFDMDGTDLKVRVKGDAVMSQRGPLNLIVKLKPSERLLREQAGLFSLLKNRDAEGFYQFTLGGTVGQPMPRL